jgi:hypothetical protein
VAIAGTIVGPGGTPVSADGVWWLVLGLGAAIAVNASFLTLSERKDAFTAPQARGS